MANENRKTCILVSRLGLDFVGRCQKKFVPFFETSSILITKRKFMARIQKIEHLKQVLTPVQEGMAVGVGQSLLEAAMGMTPAPTQSI